MDLSELGDIGLSTSQGVVVLFITTNKILFAYDSNLCLKIY